jgi:hypothetical protein
MLSVQVRFGFVGIAFLLCQCGQVIRTADFQELSQPVDGAIISYAFVRTELTVSASYKAGGALTIAAPTTAGVPDLEHVHTLVYQHNPFWVDAPDIQLNGVLLSKISSTTQDQAVTAVTSANLLLTQLAATQLALDSASKVAASPKLAAPAPNPCKEDIQVSQVIDLTRGIPQKPVVQQGSQDCYIKLDVKFSPPVRTFEFVGYPRNGDQNLTEDYCNEAVCFRSTGAYVVKITATLINTSGTVGTVPTPVDTTQQVLGAVKNEIGFVHFKRREFTTNTTTLSFNTTTGLVSEFSSSDPSEVVGFLALPTAALATAALVK